MSQHPKNNLLDINDLGHPSGYSCHFGKAKPFLPSPVSDIQKAFLVHWWMLFWQDNIHTTFHLQPLTKVASLPMPNLNPNLVQEMALEKFSITGAELLLLSYVKSWQKQGIRQTSGDALRKNSEWASQLLTKKKFKRETITNYPQEKKHACCTAGRTCAPPRPQWPLDFWSGFHKFYVDDGNL